MGISNENNNPTLKEALAKFLLDGDRIRFRDLLKNHEGEGVQLDFKEKWIEDAVLAKHIIGFANNEGGCIIFGVEELKDKNIFNPVGLTKVIDKDQVNDNLRKWLPNSLMEQFRIVNFKYEETEYEKIKGKSFQVLIIDKNSMRIPFMAIKATAKLKMNVIYYRRSGSTVEASYDEVQKILEKRTEKMQLNSKGMPLETHLSQLKLLYDSIKSQIIPLGLVGGVTSLFSDRVDLNGESYDAYVNDLILEKKEAIRLEIGTSTKNKRLNISAILENKGTFQSKTK